MSERARQEVIDYLTGARMEIDEALHAGEPWLEERFGKRLRVVSTEIGRIIHEMEKEEASE
jgi:hypothetical protein